jgi:hypothetical protein
MIYDTDLYGQKEELANECSWGHHHYHRLAKTLDMLFGMPETQKIKHATIFPIDIMMHVPFMEKADLQKILGKKILSKISNGNAILVFNFPLEGIHPFNHAANIDWNEKFLQRIVGQLKKFNIDLANVYWITGDLLGEEKHHPNGISDMNVISTDTFGQYVQHTYDYWIGKDYFDESTKFSLDKKYDFLYLNGCPRGGKCILKHALETESLLDKGLWSWLHRHEAPNYVFLQYLVNKFKVKYTADDIYNSCMPVKEIDANLDQIDAKQDYYPKEFIQNTCYSLVPETAQLEDMFFVTEKTYKPILYKHPFLLYGSPNTINYLQTQGYETYHEIFDESYDAELEINQKIRCLLDNIDAFRDRATGKEKIINEIAEHNRNIFMNEKPAWKYNKEKLTPLVTKGIVL